MKLIYRSLIGAILGSVLLSQLACSQASWLKNPFQPDAATANLRMDVEVQGFGEENYFSQGDPVPPQTVRWFDSLSAAKAEAERTDRPILMNFTGSDWCPYCVKLEDEVFHQSEFEQWAANHVVLLKVDFPRKSELPADIKNQNEQLRAQYRHHIKGFPTVLITEASGRVLGKLGYLKGGAKNWLAQASVYVPTDESPRYDLQANPATRNVRRAFPSARPGQTFPTRSANQGSNTRY